MMQSSPILNRVVGYGLLLFLGQVLLVTTALAIDPADLKSNGYAERLVDGRKVWVDDLYNRMYVLYGNGKAEHFLYSYRTTFDANAEPVTERFVDYIILTDKDDTVVEITDRWGIPHRGDDLKQTAADEDFQGTTILDFPDQYVTISVDGARRFVNKTRGSGYQTYLSGHTSRVFDASEKPLYRYGYKAVTEDGTQRLQLYSHISSNGARWELTETDEKSGEQTWVLQNSTDKNVVTRWKGRHSLKVLPDYTFVEEFPNPPP